MSDKPCDHRYVADGIRYKFGEQCPGSSARVVLYYRAFICQRCLDDKYEELDCTHDSYQGIMFGATPMKRA